MLNRRWCVVFHRRIYASLHWYASLGLSGLPNFHLNCEAVSIDWWVQGTPLTESIDEDCIMSLHNGIVGGLFCPYHYDDVIMSAIASRITSRTTVYLIVYSRADQRKHQSSASLAFVRGIHRRPVNSPHKGPVTRKMVPFDDVIMTLGPDSI